MFRSRYAQRVREAKEGDRRTLVEEAFASCLHLGTALTAQLTTRVVLLSSQLCGPR
jgi:hypothetical protein